MTHVVVDTDIMSTFIKTGKLNLLETLFVRSTILLTPSVYSELKTGQKVGMIKLSPSPIFSKIKLELAEKRAAKELRDRRKTSIADSECIAVAKNRRCLLVTNDRYTEKEADHLAIEHINLPGILRLLWKSKIMTKSQVNELINNIEKKDRIVIRNKNMIFA
jgi:predicted nucleic acid-binding protein